MCGTRQVREAGGRQAGGDTSCRSAGAQHTPALAHPSAAALTAHFRGASAVFHLASYGMSGGQQLQPRLIEAINVGGTQAVIGAAVVAGVERLVYLSTCEGASVPGRGGDACMSCTGGERCAAPCIPRTPPHPAPFRLPSTSRQCCVWRPGD